MPPDAIPEKPKLRLTPTQSTALVLVEQQQRQLLLAADMLVGVGGDRELAETLAAASSMVDEKKLKWLRGTQAVVTIAKSLPMLVSP